MILCVNKKFQTLAVLIMCNFKALKSFLVSNWTYVTKMVSLNLFYVPSWMHIRIYNKPKTVQRDLHFKAYTRNQDQDVFYYTLFKPTTRILFSFWKILGEKKWVLMIDIFVLNSDKLWNVSGQANMSKHLTFYPRTDWEICLESMNLTLLFICIVYVIYIPSISSLSTCVVNLCFTFNSLSDSKKILLPLNLWLCFLIKSLNEFWSPAGSCLFDKCVYWQ